MVLAPRPILGGRAVVTSSLSTSCAAREMLKSVNDRLRFWREEENLARATGDFDRIAVCAQFVAEYAALREAILGPERAKTQPTDTGKT